MNLKASRLGLLLCGGLSTRMGRPKATLVRPDGCLQIEYVTRLLEAVSGRVVLSASREVNLPTFPSERSNEFTLLHDEIEGQGPMLGLMSGLKYASENGFTSLMVAPIDLPALNSDHLMKMVELASEWPQSVVVAGSQTGKLHPLLAVWPAEFVSAVVQSVESNALSVYRLVERLPHRIIGMDENVLCDTNHPDAWQAWIDSTAKPHGFGN